jgi:hypothetical protein
MVENSKYPSALASKLPAIGEREKKRSTTLWTKLRRILSLRKAPQYRVIWASTLGQLETEVNKQFQHRKNVKLIGRPFHDLSWWQALTHEGDK